MGGLFLLSWANLIPSLLWMPIPTFQLNPLHLLVFTYSTNSNPYLFSCYFFVLFV